MLPTREEIKERVLSGYDRAYYDGLYSQMAYAFGEKWNANSPYVSGAGYSDDIPVYPAITAHLLEVGQSKRILETSYTILARVLSRAPSPDSPHVDEWTEEVRRQYWLANANGQRGLPTKWLKQLQYAFVEGDSLGVGCVKHGLRSHPHSGLQLAELQHVPVHQAIWDPFEFDPRNSKWVAVVSYLPLDVAKSRFGSAADRHVSSWKPNPNAVDTKFVRIIEYWDVGYAGKEPAYVLFLGDMDEGKVEPNERGFLGVSFCVNYVAPGMKRPIGRVSMQMCTQELINDIERYLRISMQQGPPVDVYDPSHFDPDSIARWKAGDQGAALEIADSIVDDVRTAFTRLPGKEVPQGVLALLNVAEKQYTADSNLSELDRGSITRSRRTLGEIAILQNAVDLNASLVGQMAVEFLQDAVRHTFMVGAHGDRQPIEMEVFGQSVVFNQPDVPRSRIANFLTGNLDVIIDLEATTAQDEDEKSAQRVQQLQALAPLVGVNVDPGKWRDEILAAMGERNLESWAMKQDLRPTQAAGQQNG